MKKTLIKSKQKTTQTLLHSNACMISVSELLHLMSTSELAGVNLHGLLCNHAPAISQISNAQIDAFIDGHKRRAEQASQYRRDSERDLLSTLAIKLRVARDAYAKRVTIH